MAMNHSVPRLLFIKLAIRKYSSQHPNLSSLGKTFNGRPNNKVSKNVTRKGLFDVPELVTHNGFLSIKEQCVIATDQLITEATNKNRTRKMVQIFDDLSDNLCKVADLADFIRLAHPSKEFTSAAEQACAVVSGLVERLNTDKGLYDALAHVVKSGDIMETNAIDDHVASLFLFDFEQCGIHLPEEQRNHVVALNDKILQIGQLFVSRANNSRRVPANIIPEYLQHLFPSDGDTVVINGLNGESPNPVAREVCFKLYMYPDNEQDTVFNMLLKARHELAATCGFQTYGERALRGCLLDTPTMVTDFLSYLDRELRKFAENDFNLMAEMKRNDKTSGPLATWDVPYYTHKYKKAMLNVTSSDFSPYFSLGSCMEGLNTIFKSIYGITLETQEISPGEVWCNDVYKLAVVHESEGLLGYIYCDFYERDGKPNQDCHFTIRGGRDVAGKYQLPVVVLMLNLPIPRWSTPTLLTPSMVDNLFHEMGHAMHSMLGRTKYQHVTGTRCSTDLAEVPSVLMEYFARDPRIVKTFARHFQTNEVMPDHMIELLCASKNIFMASEMQLQLFYSMADQCFHKGYPLEGTSLEVLAKVQNDYYSLPYVENTAWHLRFSHLVGYGAKYYSYLASTALASWIWHSYFVSDPLSRSQGERYRHNFLAHGGGKPPWALITDFLQREPSPNLLADALINEIETKRDKLDVYISRAK